ncbi:UNVERIFIED_CONTAM: hypothetical protein Sindi_2465000 [Sesamum indicum]
MGEIHVHVPFEKRAAALESIKNGGEHVSDSLLKLPGPCSGFSDDDVSMVACSSAPSESEQQRLAIEMTRDAARVDMAHDDILVEGEVAHTLEDDLMHHRPNGLDDLAVHMEQRMLTSEDDMEIIHDVVTKSNMAPKVTSDSTGLFIGKVPLHVCSDPFVDDKIAIVFNNSYRRTLSYVAPTVQNDEVIVRPTLEAIRTGSRRWRSTAVVELWTEEELSTVASGVGKPLYPDAITRACTRLDFARVCVMLDISSKLPNHITIMTPDDDCGEYPCKVDVEYEWVLPKCTSCMTLGHSVKDCTVNKVAKPGKPPVSVYVPKVTPRRLWKTKRRSLLVRIQGWSHAVWIRWKWFVDYSTVKNHIWIAWDDNFIDVEVLDVGSQFMHVCVIIRPSHEIILINVIYGTNELADRRELWGALESMVPHCVDIPWIVGDKAPGPDGYSSGFFKAAWPVVGTKITRVALDFFSTGRLLKQVNSTILALIPKVIAKLLVNGLSEVLDKMISPGQAAFIPGRKLFTGYNQRRLPSHCALKIDIRKAYDTVEWDFLLAALQLYGFPVLFIRWIEECTTTSSFSVGLNGKPHRFFVGARGLRQGDAFGLPTTDRAGWALSVSLEIGFADDVILFCRAEDESVRVFKEGLDRFGDWLELRLNVQKSHLILCRSAQDMKEELLAMLGFQEVQLPMRLKNVLLDGRGCLFHMRDECKSSNLYSLPLAYTGLRLSSSLNELSRRSRNNCDNSYERERETMVMLRWHGRRYVKD